MDKIISKTVISIGSMSTKRCMCLGETCDQLAKFIVEIGRESDIDCRITYTNNTY